MMTAKSMLSPNVQRGVMRWLFREIFGTFFVAVLLFWPAGTLAWPMGWSLVALYGLWVAANAILLMPRCPELLVERGKRSLGEQSWDRFLMSVIGVGTLAKYVVAGFDYRLGWSPALPAWLPMVAWIIAAAGFGLVTWSMLANAYFTLVVRIQEERGQQVAAGGPYRYVRHPGYVGSILFELSTPLILGSVWALAIGVTLAVAFVIRTALEDRLLHAELPGYREFASQVRSRLLPGVW